MNPIKKSILSIPFTGIMQLASAGVGFVLSFVSVYGNYTPFGIALAAAVPTPYLFTAALGSGLGYLASQTGMVSIRYLSAVIIVIIVRQSLMKLRKLTLWTGYASAVAFCCCLTTGLIFGFSRGMTSVIALIYVTEAILAAGSAFFLRDASTIALRKTSLYSLDRQQLCSVVISVTLLTVALSGIEILSISPVRTAVAYLVLVFACYGGLSAGSIAGVLSGVAVSLSGGQINVMAGYAFGGLLAAVFSPVGRLGSAAAFAAANGIVLLMEGGSPQSIASFLEVAMATVLFVAMPSSLSHQIEGMVEDYRTGAKSSAAKNTLVSRLKFASKALTEVAGSVETVSAKLDAMQGQDMRQVYRNVQQRVCTKCGLMQDCWETSKDEVCETFSMMGSVLREKEKITPSDLPTPFVERCIMLEPCLREINEGYTQLLLKECTERRVTQVRSVVADQFEGIGALLLELAQEFEEREQQDATLAKRLEPVLTSFHIQPEEIVCRTDNLNRMTIQITTRELPESLSLNALTKAVNTGCSKKFDKPTIVTIGDESRILFYQKAAYTLQTEVSQLSSGGDPFCGDAYEIFSDGKGRMIMVLSDGMGTGGRAAVDGAMAASLLSKLVGAGFGFDSALKVVNSALLVKSGDESLATLDIACIDLFSGEVEFLKAGAPTSFVCRSGRCARIEQSTLPAGILREVEFGRSVTSLSQDDMVVLVSDGAAAAGTDWIIGMLEDWRGENLKQLADRIAKEAQKRSPVGHDDDITVMVSKLESH